MVHRHTITSEGNCIVTKYLEVTMASHSVTLVFLPFDTGGLVTGDTEHCMRGHCLVSRPCTRQVNLPVDVSP